MHFLCRLFLRGVGIFVDGPNMIRKGVKVDLREIKEKARRFGEIRFAKVYLDQYAPRKLIEAVLNQGFQPILATGDIDVAMASDVIFFSCWHNLETVVIVTRDTDFVPAMLRLKEMGKRIVLMSVDAVFGKALKNHVDEFILLKNVEER